MNKLALFTDGTCNYVSPAEPSPYDKVTFTFRTGSDDIDKVTLITGKHQIPMKISKKSEVFDYYTVEWHVGNVPFLYYFKIEKEHETCYYTRAGVVEFHNNTHYFQIVPGFTTPYWAKGAVMYQIFVDRFYNGDVSNDVVTGEYDYIGGLTCKVDDWNKTLNNSSVRDFYGGDLQGIIDKLDYLEDLGVEVIYLNPIFVSPSNHKYDIQDYDYVDPHYGKIVVDGGTVLKPGELNVQATKYQIRTTNKQNLEASNALLIELIEQLHKRGMKIILDGVFNHCGSFNKWLDRERIYEKQEGYENGAFTDGESIYKSFFKFYNENENSWPYNGSYDGWWGHDTLPKLNFEGSKKLEEYILQVGKKWVSEPYNIDGWRLDVAADLGHSNEYNHYFWNKFREVVKEANPNAIILAEHYGNPKGWLQGDEWDTIMNYDAFMEPITWFLTGMEKHSDECFMELEGNSKFLVESITHHMSNMLTPSLLVSMNELSNHDHSRFLTRTNHMVGRVEHLGVEAASQFTVPAVMRTAVVIQMTWMGAPTIYYGDEVGVCGFTDPDNRRTFPWGKENHELLAFHKEMIRIHKRYPVFKEGSTDFLLAERDVLSYCRFNKNEQVIVAINNGKTWKQIQIPVWKAEVPLHAEMTRVMYSYEQGYTTVEETYYVKDGILYVNMGARSAIVLYYA